MGSAKEILEEKISKTLSVLKSDLNTVRAGRANPSLLDQINIDYYGTATPLKNIANISVPDPRSLVIAPFDPKSIRDIEKAILVSDIGINPSNDGRNIRLVIPPLTEERRKELTKLIRKMGEESKVAIRNCRRDANESLKRSEKNGELTEDDLKNDLDEIQKLTERYLKDVESMVSEKEKELMEL